MPIPCGVFTKSSFFTSSIVTLSVYRVRVAQARTLKEKKMTI